MPSCVVKKCKNHTHKQLKHTGVTYHLFPQEPQRRKTWVKIIQRERGDKNWQPSRKSVICSVHFNHNQMYDTEGHRRRLMKTAVPDLIDNSQDDDTAEAAQPGGSQSNRNLTVKRQNSQRKTTAGATEAQKVSSTHGNVITQETENARITSDIDDKYDILGKYVASKVRQLDIEQRMYVERIIHEAIYEGQMGHLNINSQLVVNTETFVSGPTDKTKEFEITNIKKEKEDDPLKVSDCENNFEELSTLGNTSCRSNLMTMQKPIDRSELNVEDVSDIKIETVEEQESLQKNLSTEYSVADPYPSRNRVGEYVYMYSDNAKRKRPNETDCEGTHPALQDSTAKTDTEMKDDWTSQEIHFGSDSNVKIKEELIDS